MRAGVGAGMRQARVAGPTTHRGSACWLLPSLQPVARTTVPLPRTSATAAAQAAWARAHGRTRGGARTCMAHARHGTRGMRGQVRGTGPKRAWGSLGRGLGDQGLAGMCWPYTQHCGVTSCPQDEVPLPTGAVPTPPDACVSHTGRFSPGAVPGPRGAQLLTHCSLLSDSSFPGACALPPPCPSTPCTACSPTWRGRLERGQEARLGRRRRGKHGVGELYCPVADQGTARQRRLCPALHQEPQELPGQQAVLSREGGAPCGTRYKVQGCGTRLRYNVRVVCQKGGRRQCVAWGARLGPGACHTRRLASTPMAHSHTPYSPLRHVTPACQGPKGHAARSGFIPCILLHWRLWWGPLMWDPHPLPVQGAGTCHGAVAGLGRDAPATRQWPCSHRHTYLRRPPPQWRALSRPS